MERSLVIIGLIILSLITVIALWQNGLSGFGDAIFYNAASLQIFIDLVIALTLFMVWMWHDAKKSGRNPWPWIIATCLVGSFGPLVYLLTRKSPNI